MPCYDCNLCNKCGMFPPLPALKCSKCGGGLPPGVKDCPTCGAPAAESMKSLMGVSAAPGGDRDNGKV